MNSEKALSFLQSKFAFKPEIGLLDYTANPIFDKELKVETRISYREVPYLNEAENGKGEVVLGRIDHFKMLVFRGYFQPGNSHSNSESFPMETMSYFGINSVFLILEALSLFKSPGPELLIASDHFRLTHSARVNRVAGAFPKMVSDFYPGEFVERAKSTAQKLGLRIPDGIICDGMGVELVSNAEYEYLRACGIGAVGSFFAADSEAAHRHQIPLLAIALLRETNWAEKEGKTALNKDLRNLILGIISSL